MSNKPDESWRKRFAHKISKRVERLKQRSERPHDHPIDRSSSAPPDLYEGQGSSQHLRASPLVQSQSLLVPDDHSPNFSREPSGSMANTPPIVSATTTPEPTVSNAQISSFVGKGTLKLLSNAAEGIPIPGVKGIFDTILKVIGAIEVRGGGPVFF